MYKPKYFEPHEFLPGLSGDETWESLDPVERAKLTDKVLMTADELRDLLGPFTINNYARGGIRVASGYRPPESTVGVPGSQHRKGNAFDGHFCSIDQARASAESVAMAAKKSKEDIKKAGHQAALKMADALREKIREAVRAGKLPYLGGMETGVTWIHCDCRPRVNGKVVEFDA